MPTRVRTIVPSYPAPLPRERKTESSGLARLQRHGWHCGWPRRERRGGERKSRARRTWGHRHDDAVRAVARYMGAAADGASMSSYRARTPAGRLCLASRGVRLSLPPARSETPNPRMTQPPLNPTAGTSPICASPRCPPSMRVGGGRSASLGQGGRHAYITPLAPLAMVRWTSM